MKGFDNLGNTCYLNSGLQMLIRNKYIYSKLNEYRGKNDIINSILSFFDNYHNGSGGNLSPKLIKNLVGKNKYAFRGFGQQDSEEFINCFLNLLDDNCNIADGKDKNLSEIGPISKILNSTFEKSIKCKAIKCLKVSKSDENMTIIQMPINENTSDLESCLIEFMKREKLDGDSQYFCENCNKLRIASKRTEIKRFQKNLLFSLKRYDSNLNKINKDIDMPLEWKSYKLKGIIYHSGNLSGGHYIYAGEENGSWFLFNDSFVSEIKNINALNQYKNFGYVYHYEKKIQP